MKTSLRQALLSALLLPFLAWPAATMAQQSQERDAQMEHFVDSLLQEMTLAEKLGQMTQVTVTDNWYEMSGMTQAGMIGSYLNVHDADMVNRIQKVAVEQSRLGIPILMARDVIHGYKTIFPIPLGQAATWNEKLVEEGARISALEATSDGIKWVFAPMLDISRDPRWGRTAESYGEDPLLTARLGAAHIHGLQGDDLSASSSVAACAKHFIAYGAAEGGRDYNSTFLGERLLRDVYMPPFKVAIDAGVATLMTSFNDNDGVPSVANRWLLKDILRDEWGYQGLIVSDWQAINELEAQGFARNHWEAVAKAALAGCEMDMMGYGYLTRLDSMVQTGRVPVSIVDEAVRSILRLKYRLGLFRQPYTAVTSQAVKYAPAHLQAAKEMATQSAILLKNDRQTLPLSVSRLRRLAVIGPMADAPHDQMGTWVFDGEKEQTQTPLQAIRELVGKQVQIDYQPGLAFSRDTAQASIQTAVRAARKADLVLLFVGEEAILSGEAHSLADLRLQGRQQELVAALSQTGRPLVTIVMAGRPLTIEAEARQSDALLYLFHPGTMGGPAIADLLFGRANPSGRLPITFPRHVGQVPIYYAHNNTGRPAIGEQMALPAIPLEAGQTSTECNSRYLDLGTAPLYPFGYGLSYTRFEYTAATADTPAVGIGDTLTVSADVTNTGMRPGCETVQLYTAQTGTSVSRPVKELRDFQRISLQPGETRRVTFRLPVSQLAFTGIDLQRRPEPGRVDIWIGPNSQEGLQLAAELKEE